MNIDHDKKKFETKMCKSEIFYYSNNIVIKQKNLMYSWHLNEKFFEIESSCFSNFLTKLFVIIS